ncbi:hypothetical protein H9625_00525 [Phocaeicola sp. Sa1CVN1]|uniref:Uncharacterized protein n=1 Tax=Phocaeicola intestinalis TaxID=2762212 RepID=A0ABR8Y410_9BACT|nr:hypothetical protein [Phocaeicola intestinalis]MBD8038947.1 hypothetical protein [Phocaeicola intestinalis]
MWSNFINFFFDGTLEESSKRQSGVCTDETTKTNSKYESDVEALKKAYSTSFATGLSIETTLKEMLELCPRERKRTDAYQGLISYLKKNYGITLIIKSRKTRQSL